MRKDVHASVAAAEKRAQHPADNADQNRTPERAAKSVHVKSANEPRHPVQHQSVYDENEKAEREQNQRRAENKQHRTHESI